jgi:vitamin B12 transporter
VLNSSFNTIQRNYNTFNSYSNSVDYSDYKSRSVNVDAFNKYSFSNQFFVVAGGQFQFHEMDEYTI